MNELPRNLLSKPKQSCNKGPLFTVCQLSHFEKLTGTETGCKIKVRLKQMSINNTNMVFAFILQKTVLIIFAFFCVWPGSFLHSHVNMYLGNVICRPGNLCSTTRAIYFQQYAATI